MSRNGSGVYSLPAGSAITNGDISDASDLNTPLQDIAADLNVARPIVAGGTGAVTVSQARTNLGLAIGTDVQAYDAGLASIAGLTTAADKMIYTTGSDTYAVADLTSFARTILDDTTAAAVHTTLGLGTAAVVDVIDEDDFATDSATRPPSQQSTKAYVATLVGEGAIATGQTWQDVTGSRALSTSYQNTTGRPIMVSIEGDNDLRLEVSSDNSTWVRVDRNTTGNNLMMNTIVPDDWYYRATTGTLATNWVELR